MERTAERIRLIDYPYFSFYNKRKGSIPKHCQVKDKEELFNISRKIWEVAANDLVDNEAGVVLDRIGYFCHWMNPVKRVFKSPRKGGMVLMPNFHTGSHFFNTTLFTNIFKKNYFKGWSFDRTFNRNIKKGRYQRLKSGHKYKLMYNLVRSFYKQKN